MRSLLCLLALLPLVLGNLSSRYAFSSTLYNRNGDTYMLHWNFSTAERTIAFAVNVSTTGWVGFGLSPNGGMVNSDVVMGWVSNGRTYFHDRFAFRQAVPPIDPSQDWLLVRGEEDGGYTILEFTRNWTTCDDRDREIEANTARVIFSWNDNDPTMPDGSDAMYHTRNGRGSASINLLGGLRSIPPDPSDTRSFAFTVNNVQIPNVDTTYWCAAYELPLEVQQQERYIIRYSPLIDNENFAYVHHMLVYICAGLNETQVNDSAPCNGGVGESLSECLAGEVLGGWAVGGEDFIYPENVAYPIGGPGSARFLVMEMHYDNPDLRSGVIDNSGIEFFYTSTRRQHEAGILTVGHAVLSSMIIPPNTGSYYIVGECSADCTRTYLPTTGVTIFADLLHTHLVGSGLTLQLIRRNQQCNVTEELAPVDINLQYDFNYQQFTFLPNQVQLLPGDTLLLNCTYCTRNRAGVTLGGLSTRDEMCLAFPVYYPRTRMSACASTVNPTALFTSFFTSGLLTPQQITQIQDSFSSTQQFRRPTQQYRDALNQVNWNSDTVQSLQQAVLNGSQYTFCRTNDSVTQLLTERENLHNVVCDYRAPDICNTNSQPVPCCQRPEVLGFTPTTMNTPTTMDTTSTVGTDSVVTALIDNKCSAFHCQAGIADHWSSLFPWACDVANLISFCRIAIYNTHRAQQTMTLGQLMIPLIDT